MKTLISTDQPSAHLPQRSIKPEKKWVRGAETLEGQVGEKGNECRWGGECVMTEIISLPRVCVCVRDCVCVRTGALGCACHLRICRVLSICHIMFWFPEDRPEVMTLRFIHVRHGGFRR